MSDLRMELIQGQLNDIEENVRSIKATWGNTIMTLDNIKSGLKAGRQKAIDEAYQKGFEAGQHEATTLEYQQGLEDAWEAIMKIAKMPDGERGKVFGDCWISNILNKYSVSEIITILGKHESEHDEIKVGDEVMYTSTSGLVDNAVGYFFGDSSDGCYKVLRYVDGKFKTGIWNKENLVKTGKHSYAVERMVAVMKEGAE